MRVLLCQEDKICIFRSTYPKEQQPVSENEDTNYYLEMWNGISSSATKMFTSKYNTFLVK